MTYDERCAEVMQAIERSKESGRMEEIDVATGPLAYGFAIDSLLDLLDSRLPGQHDGEWTKEPTVWRAWMSHDDGSHWWEIEVTVDPS